MPGGEKEGEELRCNMRPQGFSKKERILKREGFQKIYNQGKKYINQYLICGVFYPTPPRIYNRLGITVSKKIGKAFRRNYYKRIIREIYRKHKNKLKQPIEMIVIARRAITALKYKGVEENLFVLWRRARLFKNNDKKFID